MYLGPLKYAVEPKSFCKPYYKRYDKFFEAKEGCSFDDDCTTFYDVKGRGTKFLLCRENSKNVHSSKGSIQYTKHKGNIKHPLSKEIFTYYCMRHQTFHSF